MWHSKLSCFLCVTRKWAIRRTASSLSSCADIQTFWSVEWGFGFSSLAALRSSTQSPGRVLTRSYPLLIAMKPTGERRFAQKFALGPTLVASSKNFFFVVPEATLEWTLHSSLRRCPRGRVQRLSAFLTAGVCVANLLFGHAIRLVRARQGPPRRPRAVHASIFTRECSVDAKLTRGR